MFGSTKKWQRFVACSLFGLTAAVAWGQTAGPSDPEVLRKIDSKDLPNLIRVHAKVYSGGLPESDAAFAELADRGVRTIISVDGMTPDIQAARKHSLRYVHLPHGYDGVPEDRRHQLAKAVVDLPGPIYIHCHHGKHRSPTAAAVACAAAGLIDRDRAVGVLTLAGTNSNYRGLYQAAQQVGGIEPEHLQAMRFDFPEVAPVPAMAEAMVNLTHTYEHIKQIAAADWQPPADHPDLDPAHESLLLQEHFTELLRTPETKAQPAGFANFLRTSETAAGQLHRLLRQQEGRGSNAKIAAAAASQLQRVTDNCKACHAKFRDVPLQEQQQEQQQEQEQEQEPHEK